SPPPGPSAGDLSDSAWDPRSAFPKELLVMKSSRLAIVLVVAATAALSVPTYLALQPKGTLASLVDRARQGTEGARRGRLLTWPKGSSYRYAFEWNAASKASIQAAVTEEPIAGAADLRGEIVLGAIGDRAGARLVSVRFENVARHRLEMLGKDLVPDAD